MCGETACQLGRGHNFRILSEYFRGLNEAAGNMNRLGVRIARAEKTNAADRCADRKKTWGLGSVSLQNRI